MRSAALAAVLFLGACAQAPRERIVYQSVTVPVYQPCAAKISVAQRNPLPETADVFEQMKATLARIADLTAREQELEAAVAGCAGE